MAAKKQMMRQAELEEPYVPLTPHEGRDSNILSRLICYNGQEIVSNMKSDEYIERLSNPFATKTEIENLMPLENQIFSFLQKNFITTIPKMKEKIKNENEEILENIEKYAFLIRGRWIIKPSYAFPLKDSQMRQEKKEKEIKFSQNFFEYMLNEFYQNDIIGKDVFFNFIPSHAEKIKALLALIATKDQDNYVLKLVADDNLMRSNKEVVEKYKKLFDDRIKKSPREKMQQTIIKFADTPSQAVGKPAPKEAPKKIVPKEESIFKEETVEGQAFTFLKQSFAQSGIQTNGSLKLELAKIQKIQNEKNKLGKMSEDVWKKILSEHTTELGFKCSFSKILEIPPLIQLEIF